MQVRVDMKGIALVLVLVIIVVSAGLLAAVMYYSLTGTEIIGMQKKYLSAKEASLGAVDILTKEITPSILGGNQLSLLVAGLTSATIMPAGSIVAGVSNDCFLQKMTLNAANWTNCAVDPSPLNANVNPDVTFFLKYAGGGAGNPIQVNVKIVDTSEGNSDLSGNDFLTSGVVSSGGGIVPVKHLPFIYTVVTEGKLANTNMPERANLEVLYAY